MVLLKTDLPAPAGVPQSLAQWQALHRAKYNFYEGKIRNSIEGIQKIHMGSGILNFLFPRFGQSALADLEVYRRLQKLGDYTPEEVQEYKRTHNFLIESNLNNTFGTPLPIQGLAVGAIVGIMLAIRPIGLGSVLAGSLPFPVLQVLVNKWNPKHKYETLKFLDWAEQQRTANYLLEKHKDAFPESTLRDFRRAFPSQTLVNAYNDYLASLEKA